MCNNQFNLIIQLYNMNVRCFYLIAYVLLAPLMMNAQSSFNTTGKLMLSPYGSVAESIGEVFYINKGVNPTLSEGIQNGMTINYIRSKNKLKLGIYPNPTRDMLYFKVQNLFYSNLQYKLFTISGIELSNGTISNLNSNISLKSFPAATYIIKFYRNREEILSYQVIKIN